MGRFTELSDTEIAELAARFGLDPVREHRALEAGTVNSNFRLDCGEGRYFLRVNEGKDQAAVAYEAALVIGLAERGVPTPRPLRAGDRPYAEYDGNLISVFPWFPGHHLARDSVSESAAFSLGRTLGQLHDAADDITGLPEHHGIYTTELIAERLASLPDGDPALERAVPILRDEHRWLVDAGDATAQGVIHGDLFRDNVLFQGDELVALLDFEQASLGHRIYDLAVCINAWCYDQSFEPGRVRALVEGYASVRGAVAAPELWRELRRAAWRFTVTRITDVHLRGIADPDKDFRRYLARLEDWRQLGSDGLASWLS